MLGFIDDLASVIKGFFHYVAYFFAGILIVGIPLYVFAQVMEWMF